MRVLKFRAWDKRLRKMLPVVSIEQETIGVYDSGEYPRIRLSDVEVMQYTGLKDKNGVEIFEGDIVKIRFHEAPDGESFEDGVVKWWEGSAGFKWFSGEPSDLHNYWLTDSDYLGREVIGTIYEHPELLKESGSRHD